MHAKDARKPSTATRAEAGARRDGPRGGAVTPTTGVGGVLSPQTVLALQRTIGNAAVSRLVEESRHQHGAGCGHAQSSEAAPAPVQRSAVHDVLRSSGSPLDDGTRADMESRLGADFSDVRVHNDRAARASAAEVGARAYTSGNHIVIGDGGGDRHTLAHELTHVIQQRQGPVSGTDNGSGLRVSDPSDRFEREAEANARRALSGSAPVPVAGAVAEPAQRTAGGTRSSAPSVQRVPTDPEQTTSSSSSSVPSAQETAVATAPAYGTEISTPEEAIAHGLNADNTLVVNAGHSGDMYHVRAAMLLDPGLKLLMYGLLDDFDEEADRPRIAGSVRTARMTEENTPAKLEAKRVRDNAFKVRKREIQQGSNNLVVPDGVTIPPKKWRKQQADLQVEAAEAEILGAYARNMEREIEAETERRLADERDDRPRAKRAIARKATHMYQLHEDLGPNRVFFTKKSGESLGLAHGGGENISTNKFKSGMLERGAWVGAGGDATRMQNFYRDYAAPDATTAEAFNSARSNPSHPLSRFAPGVPYVIVNYRDSGHTGEGNAPALDTGRDGLAQLQSMIRDHPDLGGAQPVLIGGHPEPDTVPGPHLLKYWEWEGMKGRRSELALLSYLKENFTIVGAIGMRSGVTDQFAFAGIKTLSIDISPNQPRPKNGAAVDNEKDVEKYPSKGWERGGKLEAILGPRYGRAFLGEARTDDEKVTDGTWAGAFGERDRAMLRDAIGHFFATERVEGGTRATPDNFRHYSHPLHQHSRDELEGSTALGNAKKKAIHARVEAQMQQDELDAAKKGL
ncbi:DUF4157 domain-containing protein [Streptomyces sp. SKN60]|uniref:eCIS core domain-containing protein n=1 Tax=Streptomyces sp. SKN60 TaxID=2855506 RepID=UPI0022481ECA|nr:DUF4157 domain-containing protein [Streptomyces sp. SKN60]MCX2184911.1 DUF4157 domain-containing protein [Streptomyces sp. SKN60]